MINSSSHSEATTDAKGHKLAQPGKLKKEEADNHKRRDGGNTL